jgi:hypothetical protein
MNERLTNSFTYEHCDVPRGQSLAEWRTRQVPASRRRTQVTSGLLAAVATLAPIVLSVRGTRPR